MTKFLHHPKKILATPLVSTMMNKRWSHLVTNLPHSVAVGNLELLKSFLRNSRAGLLLPQQVDQWTDDGIFSVDSCAENTISHL